MSVQSNVVVEQKQTSDGTQSKAHSQHQRVDLDQNRKDYTPLS